MLTETEVKLVLGQLLAIEECDGAADWSRVRTLSSALLAELTGGAAPIVMAYLTEADQRKADPSFAFAQRFELLNYLRS